MSSRASRSRAAGWRSPPGLPTAPSRTCFVSSRFGPPPPDGLPSPFDWGDERYAATLLGDAFELSFEHHETMLRVASGEEDWDLFSSAPGPLKALAASLDDHGRAKLRETWIRWAEGMRQGAEIVNRHAYLVTLGTRR